MTPVELTTLLEAVRSGSSSIGQAVELLQFSNGYVENGHSTIDIDRERRTGHPEVIFCEPKRAEEIPPIVATLLAAGGLAFGTRCDPEKAEHILSNVEGGSYHELSRTIRFGRAREQWTEIETAVITAGTSDVGVAEEACMTLETFGAPVVRKYDVGVAGIHRLLGERETISRAGVCIVVAGMEGALASVVKGLFRQPVIAVPTSAGYGVALSGFTALFGMLSSCASGLTVVNIDNGFGAAMAALSILRLVESHSATSGRA